jgi:AraC family transcriptional regulator
VEWAERMNSVIDYIEQNLAEEVDYSEAAKRACCSTFYLQRTFFVVIGMTLAEYVRRRRLTLAARELSSSRVRVLDVAIKYGYDSPDAFTRAFRNMHGITPQAAREPGAQLVAFPRVSFQVVLKGGNDMDYKIIEKPTFDAIGITRRFTTEKGENLVAVRAFWSELDKTQDMSALLKLNGGKAGAITGGETLGVCMQEDENKRFSYAIAVEKPAKAAANGFKVIHIPASTWAVFGVSASVPDSGIPDAIHRVYTDIIQEWFPSTGYEHANTPELEVYFRRYANSTGYRFQVWIPVKKK